MSTTKKYAFTLPFLTLGIALTQLWQPGIRTCGLSR